MTNYISENDLIARVDWDDKETIGLITYPMGYGKSTFALQGGLLDWFNSIDEQPVKEEQVLAVSPRRAIADQTLSSYDFITVKKMADDLREDWNCYDYVRLLIIDEYHLIYKETTYNKDMSTLLEWMRCRVSHVSVIGLTATPLPYWNDGRTHFRAFQEDFAFPHKVLDNKKLAPKNQPEHIWLIENTIPEKIVLKAAGQGKAVVFLQSIKSCYDFKRKHPELRCCVVGGRNNKKIYKPTGQTFEDMFDWDTYNLLLEKQRLPINCEILLTTSFLEVGFNINDMNVENIIIQSDTPEQVKQFLGRVRHSVKNVYVCHSFNGWSRLQSLSRKYERLIGGSLDMACAYQLQQQLEKLNEDVELCVVKDKDGNLKINWPAFEYWHYEYLCYQSAYRHSDCDEVWVGDIKMPSNVEYWDQLFEGYKAKPVHYYLSDEEKGHINNETRIKNFKSWDLYLNRPLDAAARKGLQTLLGLEDKQRHPYKTLNEKVLIEYGFTIKKQFLRRDGKRYKAWTLTL